MTLASQPKSKSRKSIAPTLLIIGLLVVLYGGYRAFESGQLIESGLNAVGVVVDHHISSDTNNNMQYTAIVQFQVDNTIYTIRHDESSTRPSPEIGEQIVITYLPGDPTTARITSMASIYVSPRLLILCGIAIAGWATFGIAFRHFWRR